MALVVSSGSHTDHGLTAPQMEWLLSRFAGRSGFFIETVELPQELGTVPCGIYGPVVGDPPVPEEDVVYIFRGNRGGPSRMCSRPTRPTRILTVIAGPRGEEPCSLYTAFGGPPAPREPWDQSLRTEAEKAEAREFWTLHALCV